MSDLKQKPTEPVSLADLTDEAPQNIDELLAEFDKESATRHFTGTPKLVIQGMFIAFALYVFWMTLIATPPEQIRRASFIGLLIFLGFLVYPIKKSHIKRVNSIPWYDILFALLGSGAFFYYVLNFEAVVAKAVNIGTIEIAVGVIGTLMLIELCRRVVGLPILFVAGAFIIYAFSKGHSLKRVIHQLF